MNGNSLEQLVSPAVVEVIVRIDDKDLTISQLSHDSSDVRDAHSGIEQDCVVLAEDQEGINVGRLRNEINAWLNLLSNEP
jgi:hypothetical protein